MSGFMDGKDPKESARQLHIEGFPVTKYMEIQQQREARLKRFEEIGIPVLIENEKELIAFGEAVISHMKLLNLLKWFKENESEV